MRVCVCFCVCVTVLLAAAVVAVVKLVVFFQAKGRISYVSVSTGVPSSPHVSSADPVHQLHADQCVWSSAEMETVQTSLRPCSPQPGERAFKKFWVHCKNGVSPITNTQTHTQFEADSSPNKCSEKSGRLPSLSWQRETRVWVGSPHTPFRKPTDSHSHYSSSTNTHTEPHKTPKEKQLFWSRRELCEKCLWWDGCGWEPFQLGMHNWVYWDN